MYGKVETRHASFANNARLRLMRLSEAAEKLQRQAAISVQTGKENDARELLFQKTKVMQALEKSKSRIELLDELSVKLNEAISVKETQLIGNVALDLEVGREDTSSPVRIVSPKEEIAGNSDEIEDFDPPSSLKLSNDQELQVNSRSQADLLADAEPNNLERSLTGHIKNEAEMVQRLKGISSYENLLEHLDRELNKIEAEVDTVLRFSTLVLEGEGKPTNSNLQQLLEILEGVLHIRRRIASILQAKVGIR